MPTEEHERTATDGLIGGGKTYEQRMRERLFIFLNYFRSREELQKYLEETDRMVSTVHEQNKVIASLVMRLDKLETSLNSTIKEVEELQETRDRRAWLFESAKVAAQWFLPLAGVLVVFTQGWNFIVEYIRGGPTP